MMKPKENRRNIMKRFTMIALAVLFMAAVGATQAFAQAYVVTNNFGVRVIEQGSCERIGSGTIAGKETGDIFTVGETITVELLGNATICKTSIASYNYNGAFVSNNIGDGDYTVTSYGPNPDAFKFVGDDFFTITINAANADNTETVVFGHDDDGAICLDLRGTIYNPDDPAQQLVQVSYRSSEEATFSGDIYVATVKKKSVSVKSCEKLPPTIELCYNATQFANCGNQSYGSICIFTFTDDAAGALDGLYNFTIGKTTGAKANIGFESLLIQKRSGSFPFYSWNSLTTTVLERRDSSGNEITSDDYPDPPFHTGLFVDTSEIDVEADLTGSGTYRVMATIYYNSCAAQPGDWLVDIYANEDPCGGSFSEEDFMIADVVLCSSYPMKHIFPFAAAGPTWFNGLVLDNPHNVDIVLDVTATEEDGQVYHGSVTVPAGKMIVGIAETVINASTSSMDAALGDESYFMEITGENYFYSFMFIGDGVMAQGYMPYSYPNFLWYDPAFD
jgi:hypothetical protein